MNGIKTKKEYISEHRNLIRGINTCNYSEVKYKCDKCGGNMRKRNDIVLASNPPKYQYECDTCNNVDYLEY